MFAFHPTLGTQTAFFIQEVLDWLAVEAEADVGRKVIVGWLAVEADTEADVGRKVIVGWLAVKADAEADF